MFWKKIAASILVVFGAFSLAGCTKSAPPAAYDVSLEVWGIFDDSDAYTQILTEYHKINPHAKNIVYRKMPIETYKEDLLNALAAGKGPDIFMIRNAWRSAFEDKIAPAPDYFMTEREYRDTFVDVAASDFIGVDKKIYGAPLSVDSLALYYNKDLLNAAGITRPPVTWEELEEDVRKLTVVDSLGNITQSAIALGTANNINRATDVLAVIMSQLGSSISTLSDTNRQVSLTDGNSAKALDFYESFARVGSPLYAWNARLHNSIDAFSEGTLAFMINYSWQYDTLQQKNAKLHIGTAPLPQFQGMTPVNFANYWGYAVAKNKPPVESSARNAAPVDPVKQNTIRVHESWQFLKYMAFAPKNKMVTMRNAIDGATQDFPLTVDPTELYLIKTKKPAARRDLIEKQKADLVLAPFVAGNLIAKNWYQGNPEAVDGIFADMIDSVYRGEKKIQEALSAAASRINILLR